MILDDRTRRWKREVINHYMQHFFSLFHLSDKQHRKNFPVLPPHVTPFMNCCSMASNYWVEDGVAVLQADTHERLIPKSFWSIAVETACEKDGSYKYLRAAYASSLITAKIIDMLVDNRECTRETVYSVMFNPAEPLHHQLKEAGKAVNNLYIKMNSPELRRCDCMKYVAMAASLGTLRLKDMKVKTACVRCIVCNEVLAMPTYCALCMEAAYCGKIHQKEHWKSHKKVCPGRKAREK